VRLQYFFAGPDIDAPLRAASFRKASGFALLFDALRLEHRLQIGLLFRRIGGGRGRQQRDNIDLRAAQQIPRSVRRRRRCAPRAQRQCQRQGGPADELPVSAQALVRQAH
jgi:hypothetical protein